MSNVNKKRRFAPSFKAEVALSLISESKTISEVCSQYSLHPTQARRWRDRTISGLESLFADPKVSEIKKKNELIGELYKQVGQLKVELDWLKKKDHQQVFQLK